jgi:hypothetical protein
MAIKLLLLLLLHGQVKPDTPFGAKQQQITLYWQL